MAERFDPSQPKAPVRRIRAVVYLVVVVALVAIGVTGCMERLFYVPTREATPLPPEWAARGGEAVWINAEAGRRLKAWFLPGRSVPGDGSGRRPTILHVHGNAGSLRGHIYFTEYLPDAGFNVLIFDYRGYGESEGSGLNRRALIADTDAALDYLLTRADVDRDRIGMYGQSLGGAIGLNVMARRTEIRAAVIESAFTSWRDMAADALRLGPVGRILAFWLIRDHDRPIDAMGKIDRPILLVHGDRDSIVPVEHSRRLRAASRGGSATLVEYRGGDHNSLRDSHPEIEAEVVSFFRSAMRPSASR